MAENPNQAIREAWNLAASHFESLRESGQDVFEDIVNFPSLLGLMGNVEGKHILDAGCGIGEYTFQLDSLGAKCIGVDASERFVELSSQRYPQCSFALVDLSKPIRKFESHTFDIILSKYVLPFIEDIFVPLGEFRRLLKPLGCVVLSLGHPFSWLYHWLASYWKLNYREGFCDLEGYFKIKQIEICINEDEGIQVPLFYRPVSFYLNAFVQSGFRIARVEEPEPGADYLKMYPESKNNIVPKTLNLRLEIDACKL